MLPTAALILCLAHQSVIHLEAEAGSLKKVQVASAHPGFSGTGYVTGFTGPDCQVSWKLRAHAGLYRATIGFSTPSGTKGYDLTINGSSQGGMFPPIGEKFGRHDAGLIELKEGENTASIQGGWNYYDIDYVEFRPAPPIAAPKAVTPQLVDKQATPEAVALMRRLVHEYGRRTLMGQYDAKECDYVKAKVGRTPSILGADFIEYSPSRVEHGAKPEGTTEAIIRAAKQGQIVSMSWHWNAPTDLIDKMETGPDGKPRDHKWYRGFYTEATTFDLEKTLADPSGARYKLLLRDIDVIAVELKKLDKAKIPVLWRPLHEAEGGWFWWGAKGAEPCKKLWRLLQDRLIVHHHLHNLIWVWNSAKSTWYPGDRSVDIVAIDAYPSDHSDVLVSSWMDLQKRFDGRKLLAVGEYPGPMDVSRMARLGVWWSYNVSWTRGVGPKSDSDAFLRAAYGSAAAISLKGSK